MARLSLKLWLSKKFGKAYWEGRYKMALESKNILEKTLKLKEEEIKSYREVVASGSKKREELETKYRIVNNKLWEVNNKLQQANCELQEKAEEVLDMSDKLKQSNHELQKKVKEVIDIRNDFSEEYAQKIEYWKGRLEEETEARDNYKMIAEHYIEKSSAFRKKLFSTQGVNAKYKKMIARLKEQLKELQQVPDEDEAIEPQM